jgi:hypothetical protein
VRVTLPLLLTLAMTGALAREEVPPAPSLPVASASADQQAMAGQLELSSYSLPHFDYVDRSGQTNRVALTWLGARAPGLGLAMGMSLGMTDRTAPGAGVGGSYLRQPSVDLGFHWRYALDRQYRVDFTAWHRVTPSDAIDLVQSREPSYGARVEMGLGSSPNNGIVAERGFLGVQLDGGARVTVRRNAGKPMFYYRTTF